MEGDPLQVNILLTRRSILKLITIVFLIFIKGEYVMRVEDGSS
jgi:hypothetical protein